MFSMLGIKMLKSRSTAGLVALVILILALGWYPLSEDGTPHKFGNHGSSQSHRQIRESQTINNYSDIVTHDTQKAHNWHLKGKIPYPITDLKRTYDEFPFGHRASGNIVWVNTPARTVSVLEPFDAGGCGYRHRATVDVSAKQEDCLVAINAGFFNPITGDCYGNIVSNNRFVQTSGGLQNAHFGIRADGTLVFGYLSEEEVRQKENPFIQLVGGVVWLIRDGKIYAEESRKAESEGVEDSGSLDTFLHMPSGRAAVGSDDQGRVVIAAVDGRSRVRGPSLASFASWLLSHGVKNAINLDGGGSVTFVVNGSIVNNPSDYCRNQAYRCPRQVSTIICVHEPRCDPRDCNNHGDCIQGECHCHDNWHGASCDQLQCGDHNCSGTGNCHGDGCHCDVGYLPPDCSRTCPSGWYGQDCSHHCDCVHGVSCDPINGECTCLPGYTGKHCQDSIGECLASRTTKNEGLGKDKTLLEDQLIVLLICAVAVAVVSIIFNVIFLCFRCSCKFSTLSRDNTFDNPYRAHNGYSVHNQH